jgi:uncharacterized protein YfaS (alpha-2-macroglobulin family)
MTEQIYQDGTVYLFARWKDIDGALVDPASQTVTINPPRGTTVTCTGVYAGGIVASGTGYYYYAYDTPSTAPLGEWKVRWKATIATLDDVRGINFEVI